MIMDKETNFRQLFLFLCTWKKVEQCKSRVITTPYVISDQSFHNILFLKICWVLQEKSKTKNL